MRLVFADFKSNFFDKPRHLLGAAADVQLRVQNIPDLARRHTESAGIGEPLGQVALAAVFHFLRRFHRADTDGFVQLLTVAATLHALHEDVFGRKKRHIFVKRFFYDLLIDPEAGNYIYDQPQNRIGAQKRLGHGDAAVRRIVKAALEPLHGGGHGGVGDIGHEVAGQRANALAAHGIALVRHRRRADLRRAEGLFKLPVVLQKANVVGHAVAALGYLAEGVQYPAVKLAGVGLPADIEAFSKAEALGKAAVHLVDLSAVIVKQLHEACFRAGGAAAAEEFYILNYKIELF